MLVALTTEGVDYSNVRSRRVFERVRESGAAVYTLLVAGRGSAGRADFADAGRQRAEMERSTWCSSAARAIPAGGARFVLTSLGVEHALLEFATELRNQHLVTYARPDALIPPERIEVEVNRAGLSARGTPLKAD